MDQTPQTIVQAMLGGDYQTVVRTLVVFGVVHYGAFLVTFLRKKYLEFVAMGRQKLHDLTPIALQGIEDRFFDLMEKAVSQQIHLDPAMAELAANGQLDTPTLQKLGGAVIEDMKAGTGVVDLTSFAMALFGNTKEINADGTASPVLARAMKVKVETNLARVAGEVGNRVGERRLSRAIKARELAAPIPPK